MKQLFEGSITKVHGIRVGQAQNDAAKTGVTVVLCSHDGLYAGLGVGWPRLPDIRRSIWHALVRRAGGRARQPADPPQNPATQVADLRLLPGTSDHFADSGKNILKKG